MPIAKFYKLEWNINPSEVKLLTGIESESKLKTDTNGNTGEQKFAGYELKPLKFSYKLSKSAGANIVREIELLRSIRGVTAPFYLNKHRLFAPAYMLTDFSVSNFVLANDGQILECDISLSFIEVNITLGTSSLRVIYNDVDITNDIAVTGCEHTMNAEGAPDEVEIKFTDNDHLWDDWQPSKTDTIQVKDGIADSGKMFIESVNPTNGYMTLRGSSIPTTMRDVIKENNKSWEGVTFLQLFTEIGGRHGLEVESHEVENRTYNYIKQENISDLEFLTELCDLEGCAFLVFDKKLVVYSPEKMEAQSPVKTINIPSGSDFTYTDDSLAAYGNCEIDNGALVGKATASNGIEKTMRRVIKCFIETQADANNGAKNILAKANRGLKTGRLKTDIMKDIAAASVATLNTADASTNNGTIFYQKIVQDYVNKKTIHYFRFV
ncbi:MAG: hypothetical protein IJ681_00475 [Bacteroidales bacterium]|nr:hypothetical protein [Bacteroidales bacterium]